MNTKNIKTYEPRTLTLKLTDKINLKRIDKYIYMIYIYIYIYRTINIKSIDVKSSTFINFGVENNDKNLKLKSR